MASPLRTVGPIAGLGLLMGCLDMTPVAPPPPGQGPVTPPRIGYFVAPGGAAGSDGSFGRPWNLATALAGGNGRIQPGDTVWLRGGTYRGAFQSTLAGAPGAPVVVRQLPGERAVIDVAGATSTVTRGDGFVVRGDWTVWWGFELMSSDANRTSATRPNLVVNHASHTKYINLVVHDGGIGFYTFPTATNVEVSGAIFYNNGWSGPTRHQSNALYLQSDVGPVELYGNILFNQFGYGVHAYSDPGSGALNNIRLERNVAFNNGTLAPNSNSANILVGGYERADGLMMVANRTYYSPGVHARNVHLGYDTLMNGMVTLSGNTFVGGAPVLDVGFWSAANVTGDTLAGDTTVVSLRNPTPWNHAWGGNQYYGDPASAAWNFVGLPYTLGAWQAATGLGASDQAAPQPPPAPLVSLIPDRYEPGRATVVIYNWGLQSSVPVDLTGLLATGEQYEVRNVQTLFAVPLVSGVYAGGAVLLPMTQVAPHPPIGFNTSPAPRTGPEFNVFLITTR
jgi:hypothetical protein